MMNDHPERGRLSYLLHIPGGEDRYITTRYETFFSKDGICHGAFVAETWGPIPTGTGATLREAVFDLVHQMCLDTGLKIAVSIEPEIKASS